MDEVLKLEIFYIELFHIIAIVIAVICLLIIRSKAKKGPMLNAFSYLLILMLFWMITKVLKTVSPNLTLRWLFVVLQYVAVSFVQPAFVEFGYIYLSGKTFRKKLRAVLYIIPLVQIFIIATNPHHHLFYSDFNFRSNTFGPLFYIHMGIEYFYLLIGIIFCGNKVRRQFKEKPATGILLSIAILFPIVFNIFFITFNFKKFLLMLGIPFSFDATPIAFTMSLILFVLSTFKHGFLDLAPMMQHEIVQKLDMPIIIYNNHEKQLDANIAAADLKLNLLGEGDYYRLNEDIINQEPFQHEGKSYNVIRKDIKERRKTIHVFVFDDITEQINLKKCMDGQNANLETHNTLLEQQIQLLAATSDVAAHNYVARELHDVVGHSLVLAMRLEEMAKMIYSEDRAAAAGKMFESKLSVENGLVELRMSVVKHETFKLSSNTLKRELEEMILKVNHTNIEVKFYFRGGAVVLYEELYNGILNIIKESLTNVLKYAKADRAIISIRFEGDSAEIYIIDNGVGCKKLNKGNGLRGIEERVRALKGEIHYVYEDRAGFQTQVKLPVRV